MVSSFLLEFFIDCFRIGILYGQYRHESMIPRPDRHAPIKGLPLGYPAELKSGVQYGAIDIFSLLRNTLGLLPLKSLSFSEGHAVFPAVEPLKQFLAALLDGAFGPLGFNSIADLIMHLFELAPLCRLMLFNPQNHYAIVIKLQRLAITSFLQHLRA